MCMLLLSLRYACKRDLLLVGTLCWGLAFQAMLGFLMLHTVGTCRLRLRLCTQRLPTSSSSLKSLESALSAHLLSV